MKLYCKTSMMLVLEWKIEVAVNMLSKGSDIEFVRDCKGRSYDEILKLSSKNSN